jgi:hypothetical protein
LPILFFENNLADSDLERPSNWFIGHLNAVFLTMGLLQLCGNRITPPLQVRPVCHSTLAAHPALIGTEYPAA